MSRSVYLLRGFGGRTGVFQVHRKVDKINFLREMTLTEQCRACWTKIAHETNSDSKAYGCLLRNMGKLAGVPDFIFTWENHCLWLELKNGHDKRLSNDQVFFQNWCTETQSPHVVAYTFDEAIEILKQVGIIGK